MGAEDLGSVLARRVVIHDADGNQLQHSWAVGQVVVWKLRREQATEGRRWCVCDPHEEHLWMAETADRRLAFRMAHERDREMHRAARGATEEGGEP